jgi:hypothetical protein
MRDLSFGYTNHLAAYQSLKCPVGNERDSEARPGIGHKNNPRYHYVPFGEGKRDAVTERFDGIGEAIEGVDWKCDCGYIRAPQSSEWECCPKCGSTREPEYR